MSSTIQNQQDRTRRISARAQRRVEEQRRAKRRRLYLLGGAISVVLVAVIALIFVSRGSSSATGLPAVVAAQPLDASIPQNGRVLGDPNAPIALVEWADFQCPYCGAFSQQVLPQVINDYVKAGKVKVEFRDFPFLDSGASDGESHLASEAAAAAADQGKFWAFNEILYANQHGENQGAFSRARLGEMAQLVGLDMTQFNAAMDAQSHQADIQASYDQAVKDGVNSTPTVMVNGKTIQYTGNYQDLKAAIDAALAGA